MIASYYELKTSKRHLIKAERPQEVIKKILTRPNDRFGLKRSHRSRTHPHCRQHRCEWCWIYLPVDFKSASIVNIVVENGDLLFLLLLFLSCYVVCKYLIFGLLAQNYAIIYFRHSCGGWFLLLLWCNRLHSTPLSVLFLFWDLEISGKTVWNMADFSELCI